MAIDEFPEVRSQSGLLLYCMACGVTYFVYGLLEG